MMAKLTGSEELSLSDMLRAATVARPDRTAVSCGTERLTFQQLSERSKNMARHLRQLGAVANEPVGIFMEPSVDLMASVWGVLHAGAAYLPLSPEYPDERVRYMVADSQAKVILTDESLASRLAAMTPPGTKIVTVAQTQAQAQTRTQAHLEAAPDAGSTTKPAPSQAVSYTHLTLPTILLV